MLDLVSQTSGGAKALMTRELARVFVRFVAQPSLAKQEGGAMRAAQRRYQHLPLRWTFAPAESRAFPF